MKWHKVACMLELNINPSTEENAQTVQGWCASYPYVRKTKHLRNSWIESLKTKNKNKQFILGKIIKKSFSLFIIQWKCNNLHLWKSLYFSNFHHSNSNAVSNLQILLIVIILRNYWKFLIHTEESRGKNFSVSWKKTSPGETMDSNMDKVRGPSLLCCLIQKMHLFVSWVSVLPHFFMYLAQ